MDGVKLMNRIDTKFTFHISQLPALLADLKTDYKCLRFNNELSNFYSTLYFDTEQFHLYQKHHNGQLNRHKVRHRTYSNSGLAYLEVKLKTNKNLTIKTRIKSPLMLNGFNEETFSFLKKELPFNPLHLKPVVWVNYTRMTLVSKTASERVTLDINLEVKNTNSKYELNNLVIAEVKQEGKQNSVFITQAKKHQLRKSAISKYCFAILLTQPNVKKNNFKEKLRNINDLLSNELVTNSY